MYKCRDAIYYHMSIFSIVSVRQVHIHLDQGLKTQVAWSWRVGWHPRREENWLQRHSYPLPAQRCKTTLFVLSRHAKTTQSKMQRMQRSTHSIIWEKLRIILLMLQVHSKRIQKFNKIPHSSTNPTRRYWDVKIPLTVPSLEIFHHPVP